MQPLPEHNLELVVAGVLKKVFRFLLGLFCEFFMKFFFVFVRRLLLQKKERRLGLVAHHVIDQTRCC